MQVLNGFVKIHRKLIQWEWYQNCVVKDLFLHLLLLASFRDVSWQGRIIKKGQVITSYKSLSEDLGFGERRIRTALDKLKSTGEITSEATSKYTVITIVNWEDYQFAEEKETIESTNKQTSDRHSTDIQATSDRHYRKNVKNNKECKENKAPVSPSLERELTAAGITYEEYERIKNQ